MKKLMSNETLDRLSELPDSVILQILSLLEMEDVVRTTVLSKRWQHLWTTVLCLDFGKSNFNIRNFVNRALMLWQGVKILKFKIDLSDIEYKFYYDKEFCESLCGDMDLWVRFVTKRNVEELYLHFPYGRQNVGNYTTFKNEFADPIDPVYSLPQFLYSYSSMTKLSVVGCILQVNGVVHWHQLKSLTIHVSSVTEDVINKVVSGTPKLESFDLSIMLESYENLSIQSSSLKKLSIKKNPECLEYDPSNYTMLTIWAPNLEALVISGTPYSMCLMKDVSSLIDVKLNLKQPEFSANSANLRGTLWQILPTFQHVKVIALSPWCSKVLQDMKGKYSLSPLSNVKQLRLTYGRYMYHEIVGLLEIFPMVKMLDIYLRPRARNSEQDIEESLNSEIIKSMMQLRIVEIHGYIYDQESLFQFIEFFLKHATMLEKLVIQKRGLRGGSDAMIRAAEKLLSLQRSFPTVELIFCEKR